MSQITTSGADTVSSGDVVDLILADHREFERLFRALRNREEDRPARLGELSNLLVAHALAEESEVYPRLKQQAPSEADEVEHGVEEHAEGHEALANLLAVSDVDSEEFEESLEELVEAVGHHIDEEEREVLNAAREQVPEQVRRELGQAFMRARLGWLQNDAGAPDRVQDMVDDYRARGVL